MEEIHSQDRSVSAYKKFFIGFSILCAGIVVGFLCRGFFIQSLVPLQDDDSSTDLREGGYEFISPLIDVEPAEPTERKDLDDLEAGLRSDIALSVKTPATSHVSQISIYYKELNSEAWFGINENEKFSPASLLKMPLLIAYYKKTETDPNLLNTKLEFHVAKTGYTQNISPEKDLMEGKKYSIEELLEQMIIYSDNQAYSFLYNQMDATERNKAYARLNLQIPDDAKTDDFMTVKGYSSFFRILYNATYLSKDLSTKALKLLSKVNFTQGIVAGVPSGTIVSHKFGERGTSDNVTTQMHDCGIVYAPNKPYLLCVMTRGNDFGAQEKAVQRISKKIYDDVIKQ